MARAIDKQAMLDLIVEAKRADPETGSFAEWLAEYLVKSLSTFAPPNKWVSVEERLPEIGGSYLCVWQGRTIDTGFFLNGHFRLYGEIKDHLITHWMPLPALPDHRLPEEGRKTDGQ